MRSTLFVTFALLLPLVACGDDEPASPTSSASSSSSSAGSGGAGGSTTSTSTTGAGGMGGAGCVDSLPADLPVPDLLSATGLYSDTPAQILNPQVSRFTPRWVLWSDDATKDRYVYIPECSQIDTSDMNDWSLPVGTRLWKSFTRDGTLIETRLTQRVGSGPYDWVMTSYVWNEAFTDAVRTPDGLSNAKGTAHDVPSEAACRQCHGALEPKGGGRPSRALGFSALQLSHAGSELTLDDLAMAGKLSAPPAAPLDVPGDATTVAALGALHVNCGPCHNASADAVPQLDLNLWLDAGLASVEESGAYLTAVGRPNQVFADQQVTGRVVSGSPDESSIWFRMSQRGNNAAMPPVGTEDVDAAGLAAVEAWILGLSQ